MRNMVGVRLASIGKRVSSHVAKADMLVYSGRRQAAPRLYSLFVNHRALQQYGIVSKDKLKEKVHYHNVNPQF
ncbi:hypothetical protein KIM372_02800 [Bombiscardovia nodaiensis]|uniref:Uncharacterized protein n=1 Tax=Bombiscardovia nodaiensis TaxID=2932181 RepID=A0ABN6SAD6_9BIFI|nr:hypothetical protein KIM372_02800 [Bombiscardovia nodaiensis]